ncbi:hypothetical protein Q1695_007186 [Nippostrongylus brasiliensis]|nr:hypothetical protein Q1695_007186 [Nippostrongylus brasiliensis]
MSEEVKTTRSELVASISSQVADGIGPIISQLVDKKLKEERKGTPSCTSTQPKLSHPGLQAQASLLTKWIGQVEEIETEPDSEEQQRKIGDLKKALKRRLTTVVGADTDSSIFSLADNFEKVDNLIDQSDEFGKAVAEHLKKLSNSKNQESRKKAKLEPPFRRSGYPGEAGVPARAFYQPSKQPFIPQFLPNPSPANFAQF